MLLSDWLWFFHKTIIALSGGHFEYFLSFPKKITLVYRLAALGGADAVVFGGGIGENSPPVRSRICAGMEWCGMAIDENRNNTTIGIEGKISRDDAKVQIYVIPVDEAVMIARDTVRCLQDQKKKKR